MEEKQNNIAEEKEIDLLALANKIWVNKKLVLKALGIGLVIGLVVAFSIPKEYTTAVILTPESKSTTSGNMGSLAALAGINLNSAVGEDALASPELYPEVLSSTPFIRRLLNIRVKDSSQNIDTTLYVYMRDYQSAAWWNSIVKAPFAIISLFKSEDSNDKITVMVGSRVISKEEMGIIDDLRSRLSSSYDKKTGLTTVDLMMQSSEISAYLADTITSYLQSYIIDYRTQKARKDLAYSEKLYEESKAYYYKTQAALAAYIDGNMNVVSAKYGTTKERLQNEASLAYTVYNQMVQQLQLTKVKVQDTTPVFTVIQPAVQPFIPSKPSKKLTVIVFIFLSFVGVLGWILRKELFEMLRKNGEKG